MSDVNDVTSPLDDKALTHIDHEWWCLNPQPCSAQSYQALAVVRAERARIRAWYEHLMPGGVSSVDCPERMGRNRACCRSCPSSNRRARCPMSAPTFDPTTNCPTHFAGGDPTCPACVAKQRAGTTPTLDEVREYLTAYEGHAAALAAAQARVRELEKVVLDCHTQHTHDTERLAEWQREVERRDEMLAYDAQRIRELEACAQFVDWVRQEWHHEGGIDGDALHKALVECGLLTPTEVIAPCAPDVCACAEVGFPTTCYRWIDAARGAT